MIILCCNDSYWDPVRQAPVPGGTVDVVHGRTMAALQALGVDARWSRQPVEGATNVYLWGRSHFERVTSEVAIYVGHGIADKGNWAYQAPHFDLMLTPNWFTARKAGPKGFSAGIPMLDPWSRTTRKRWNGSRPIRVLYTTTVNPRPHVGNLSTIGQSGNWAEALGGAEGITLRVAQHPSQSRRGPGRQALPLNVLARSDVVVADLGSHLSAAIALGIPTVVPSHLEGVPGSIEAQLAGASRRAGIADVVAAVRTAAEDGPTHYERMMSTMVLDPGHRAVSAQHVAWWLEAVDNNRGKILARKGSGTPPRR